MDIIQVAFYITSYFLLHNRFWATEAPVFNYHPNHILPAPFEKYGINSLGSSHRPRACEPQPQDLLKSGAPVIQI